MDVTSGTVTLRSERRTIVSVSDTPSSKYCGMLQRK